MERTKLTIRVDRDLLEQAKRYARENDTNLTRLVSTYLGRIVSRNDPLTEAPTVRRLSGILPPEASVEVYQKYLAEKYASQSQGTG